VLLLRLPTVVRTSAWPRFLYVAYDFLSSVLLANLLLVNVFLNRHCLASPRLRPGATRKCGFCSGDFDSRCAGHVFCFSSFFVSSLWLFPTAFSLPVLIFRLAMGCKDVSTINKD
jgi:hypothetical protein